MALMDSMESAVLGAVLAIIALSLGIVVWTFQRAVRDHLRDKREELSPSAVQLKKLGDVIREWHENGGQFVVTSQFRTAEEQEALYERYQRERGMVGRSNHDPEGGVYYG